MDEKKRNIQIGCSIVGLVLLLIYAILTVVGSNTVVLFALRILFAGIAAIVYAIKMGVEISNDDFCGGSALLIAICLCNIMISAMQL